MKLAQKSEFTPQKWSLNTNTYEFLMKRIGFPKNCNIQAFFDKCCESSVRTFRKKTPISVRRCRGGGGGGLRGEQKRSAVLWLFYTDGLPNSIFMSYLTFFNVHAILQYFLHFSQKGKLLDWTNTRLTGLNAVFALKTPQYYGNIARIANAVQCHNWLSDNKDCHGFRFSIIRIVISVSKVTSLWDCSLRVFCKGGR